MGAAQPNDSESESEASSDESETPINRRRPEALKADTESGGAKTSGNDGRGARNQRRSGTEEKGSPRDSSSSEDEDDEEEAQRQQVGGGGLLFWSCCGSGGMESAAKEYLGDAPQAPPRRRQQPRQNDKKSSSSHGPGSNSSEKNKNTSISPTVDQDDVPQTGICKANLPGARHDDEDEDDDDGARSARSTFSCATAVVAQCSRSSGGGGSGSGAGAMDAASLKAALKNFVRGMVRGRELHVLPAGGGLRPTEIKLTPDVDALLVDDQGTQQRVPLKDILQVHHGLEAMALDLGAQLDNCVVVLELTNGSCLSFHLGHAASAEEFVLCLRLLTSMRRQQSRKTGDNPANKSNDKSGDNDDTRSECSIQTGIVQQQLSCTPISSACASDPKEAKRMFKMFTETMRRGRDFYVVKKGGELVDVECSLQQQHEEFRMRWEFQTRSIMLRDFLNVLPWRKAKSLHLGYPLDERCSTIELNSGECITFKFGHVEACERFILCMCMLVEQKRPRFASQSFVPGSDSGIQPVDDMFGPPPPESARSTTSSSSKKDRRRKSAGGGGGGAPASSSSVSRGASPQPPSQSGVSAVGGSAPSERQVVEAFVRQMVLGTQLSVVGPGTSQQVQVSLDAGLRSIQLTASDGSKREVILSMVKTVHSGEEAAQLGLEGIALDGLCATMELVSGDCVTFRFPTVEQRYQFVLCTRLFSKGPG